MLPARLARPTQQSRGVLGSPTEPSGLSRVLLIFYPPRPVSLAGLAERAAGVWVVLASSHAAARHKYWLGDPGRPTKNVSAPMGSRLLAGEIEDWESERAVDTEQTCGGCNGVALGLETDDDAAAFVAPDNLLVLPVGQILQGGIRCSGCSSVTLHAYLCCGRLAHSACLIIARRCKSRAGSWPERHSKGTCSYGRRNIGRPYFVACC